ncbi:hypothetical protein DFH11DRAFT_1515645 [Phellopilus nigrolimitatus]|nr:hypothetical protein DFH11DRAFT_1515645 [Phellopilus nigrolimitatus]
MSATASQNCSFIDAHNTETHWIEPISPSRLDGCLSLPVPGMDQNFSPIYATWLIPCLMDIQRLKIAIAQALAAYPHVCGRLKRLEDGNWKIVLSKSAIPLIVTTGDRTPTDKQLSEGDCPVFDPLPWLHAPPVDVENHPLIRWKVTNYPSCNECVIVITSCHVLGDGWTISMLQQTVSDFYEGVALSRPLPTFEKYFEVPSPLSGIAPEHLMEYMPHLREGYDQEQIAEKWNSKMETTERVDIVFNDEQMSVLQKMASLGAGRRPSKGDTIIAYLFTVFNRVYPYPFNRLMNVVGYRGRKLSLGGAYEFPALSATGNVIVYTVSPAISEPKLLDIGALASVVRETIRITQDPKSLHDCIALCEQRFSEMGRTNQIPWMFPGERILAANLLHRVPFHTQHFGAGQCCFYLYPSNENYIRVFEANPIRMSDGTWHACGGSLHAYFRVPRGMAEKVYETVKRDFSETHVSGSEPPEVTTELEKWKSQVSARL